MNDKSLKSSSPSRLQPNPSSLNSMQIAINFLKDRCEKQQKKIEELEEENLTIMSSKNGIYAEMKKLHEANDELREKNLQLSHSLKVKSKECTELNKKLEDLRLNDNISARQIERLQNQIAIISRRDADIEPISFTSISEEARESYNSEDPVTAADTRNLVEKVSNNFNSIKEKLLEEQRKLQVAVDVLQKNKLNSDQKVESLINAGLSAALKRPDIQVSRCRRCPMCEAEFPLEISQDEFECHVVEHFSYEESETLRHFDTVPDAYWSCHNSIEENLSSS